MLLKRRQYHSPLSSEELSKRLAESVAPRDSRGFFAHWTGKDPDKVYVGKVGETDCRILRLPEGGKRLFEVDLLARWSSDQEGCNVKVTQRAFPCQWFIGLLGLTVVTLSALGEVLVDQNWGGAILWVGLFAVVYSLYATAFRQVASLNETFLTELWELSE